MHSSLDLAPLSQETDYTGRNGLLSAQTLEQVVTLLGDNSCIHCTSLQMQESNLYALSASNVTSYMLCQYFSKISLRTPLQSIDRVDRGTFGLQGIISM